MMRLVAVASVLALIGVSSATARCMRIPQPRADLAGCYWSFADKTRYCPFDVFRRVSTQRPCVDRDGMRTCVLEGLNKSRAASLVPVPATFVTGAKRDIRGFRTEMTLDQARSNAAAVGCIEQRPGFILPDMACTLPDRSFILITSTVFGVPKVAAVEMRFNSGASPQEIADQVSQQFGVRASIVADRNGKPEANWLIGPALLMALRVRSEPDYKYELTINDDAACAGDANAERAARQSVNPRPKF